jgi:hypothetical protein
MKTSELLFERFLTMSNKSLIPTLFLAGILFVPFSSVLAQQPDAIAKPTISPEKRALIAELLEALEAKKNSLALFNSVLDQDEKQMPDLIWQGVLNTKAGQELSDGSKEELRKKLVEDSARLSKRTRELFLERIDLGSLVEEVSTNIYDKYFTEAEIKDLTAFYKSSTGKKAIDVMPKMFAETMANTMETMKPRVLAIITELTDEEAERIKKEFETKKREDPPPARPGRSRRKPH